jgi:Phytanoyl-CoA dioxygenase (PhyH)
VEQAFARFRPVALKRLLGRQEPFSPPALDDVQRHVLETMKRDGIAVVSFEELVDDRQLWETLSNDIAAFASHTEANLDELRAQQKKKSYLIRRFLKSGEQFGLDHPWLGFGLSSRVLDVVNSYRNEATWLIDLDNWYTIPDPEAEDRVASQRWHRDPWDNHIVKVFTYFSDVDREAGPFEYLRGSPAGGRNCHLWPWEGDEVYEAHGLYPPQDEFESRAPAEDVLTATGPPGTMVFADTSGFHRGGWTRSKPRILSYASYVSTRFRLSPRFQVDWSHGNGLSDAAEFAIAWSR